MKVISFNTLIIGIVALGFCSPTLADDQTSRWNGALSLGLGLTGLKDNDPTHVMVHENLGLFGGYRFDRLVVGPVFDLRMMQQLSKISSVGGTNFTGTGSYGGLGIGYDFNPAWSLQTSFLFAGEFRFDRQTYASEEARLTQPLGISIRPQYHYNSEKPYSLDLDLRVLRWANFTAAGVSLKSVTEVGLGLIFTFHFPKPSAHPLPEQPEQPATKKQTTYQTISLAGSLFRTGSADLDDNAARDQLVQAAGQLAANPKLWVRIEGHTDSVGTDEKNQLLSQARAERIKAILVEGGVSADRISAQGFGPNKPIADNTTKEGRAKNRRVEIYIDEK